MCSGSEAGLYLRLIDLMYHSTLGLRVKEEEKKKKGGGFGNRRGAPIEGYPTPEASKPSARNPTHAARSIVHGLRGAFVKTEYAYRGTSLIRNRPPP